MMINITKASGKLVPFNPEKLRQSLLKVGAFAQLVDEIVAEVNNSLYEGMSTHKIYGIAFKLLRRKSKALAAKFHLKKAIMRLGTTGYPFEQYIAAIFRHKEFDTSVDQIIHGKCVRHEIDIVAKKKDICIYVECKYHNSQGIKCTVKIPLYVKARYLDIAETQKNISTNHSEMWLVTNTRFTNDARKYGICAGLHLISWDFPEHESLKEQIEVSGLYPITCITQLTNAELTQLFAKNIVLCKSLIENPTLLDNLRISSNRKSSIIEQCQKLCRKLS